RVGCVRPVDEAEYVPLVAAGVVPVRRLAPDLEREAGAVAALAAGVRVLLRIARRVVAIVVVPAAARPLVSLAARPERDLHRAAFREVLRRRRVVPIAVLRDEVGVVGAGAVRGSAHGGDREGRCEGERTAPVG